MEPQLAWRVLCRSIQCHRPVARMGQTEQRCAADRRGGGSVCLLVTTDRRIRYQQNLAQRKIAIVVLAGSTRWSRIRVHFDQISAAVNAAVPGTYVEVEITFG